VETFHDAGPLILNIGQFLTNKELAITIEEFRTVEEEGVKGALSEL
jgi:hypothetical protein